MDENMYDPRENAPVGYTPTALASLTEWQLSAGDQKNPEVKTVTHTTLRIDESPFIFEIFVLWAYTQQLELDRFGPAGNKYCAALYGLSERLDIPVLRQQYYRDLLAIYNNKKIPDVGVAEVIIKQCSKTSRLHEYLVDLICESMMDGTTKHLCEPILNLQEDFASEVANQILANLRNALSLSSNYSWTSDADDSDSEYYLSEDDLESADDSSQVMSDIESDGSDTEEGDNVIEKVDESSSDHGLEAMVDLAEVADAMPLDEDATKIGAEAAGTAIPCRDPENHSLMPTSDGDDVHGNKGSNDDTDEHKTGTAQPKVRRNSGNAGDDVDDYVVLDDN